MGRHAPQNIPVNRHRAIIEKVGGYAKLASVLGLGLETVKSWQKCDRGIPPRYWHRVMALDPSLTAAYLERTAPPRKLRGAE